MSFHWWYFKLFKWTCQKRHNHCLSRNCEKYLVRFVTSLSKCIHFMLHRWKYLKSSCAFVFILLVLILQFSCLAFQDHKPANCFTYLSLEVSQDNMSVYLTKCNWHILHVSFLKQCCLYYPGCWKLVYKITIINVILNLCSILLIS